MNMASVVTVCTMPYVFIMHWQRKRPTTQKSNMFLGYRLPIKPNTSFKLGKRFNNFKV